MRRENQDAYSGKFLADHPGRVEALGQMIRGHPDVDDGQVRTMPADQGQEPRRVVGLAHHLEPCSFEQARDSLPKQDVIVRQHDAHPCFAHFASSPYSGRGGIRTRLQASSRWSQGRAMGARGATDTRGLRRGSGRLTGRAVAVSVLLSAVIGSAFFLLVLALEGFIESDRRANHSQEVLIAASRLERLVVDVETTHRGFVITGDSRSLPPWYQARVAFAQEAADLERLARAGNVGQGIRARHIARTADSYFRDYAVPLVAAGQRDPGSARTVELTEQGMRRVDALRDSFERFMAFERRIFRNGQQQADAAADRAFVAATLTFAGSIVLILLSGGYLARSVVRPVHRASAMADRVAGGHLPVRMPETGPGEGGILERAFNSIAGLPPTSNPQLARAPEEQARPRGRA